MSTERDKMKKKVYLHIKHTIKLDRRKTVYGAMHELWSGKGDGRCAGCLPFGIMFLLIL